MEFNFTDFEDFLDFLEKETNADEMNNFINKYGNSFVIDRFRGDYLEYVANGEETTYLDRYNEYSQYLNNNDTKLAVMGKYTLDFIFLDIARNFDFDEELEYYEVNTSIENKLNLYGNLGINIIASDIISSEDIGFQF
jgi:hypothetical protein